MKASSACVCHTILGGSWVVINGVIGTLMWIITIETLLTTPLNYNHP